MRVASISALLCASVAAQSSSTSTSSVYTIPSHAPYTGVAGDPTVQGGGSGPDADGKYTIQAEGIRLQFVPYGASISNLFITDKQGVERDIVLGWDNATYYTEDKIHPHFGAVPGRYANRIKNSTFDIDGITYNVAPNEHNGANQLHGGPKGWDWTNFTVVAHTTDSITFSIASPDNDQGFPGEVVSYVTYTAAKMTWNIRMVAMALTKATPIMLSSHTYWNLDGFANPDQRSALNHTIHLPYSGQRVGVDNILIPDGSILPNQKYSVNDFWSSPKQLGANLTGDAALNNCGYNCTGYDTCYLVNRAAPYDWRDKPVATLASEWSGISVNVFSDQEAFQIFGCNNYDDSVAVKKTQGTPDARTIPAYGCIVMEVEDWIDGINQPEWGREDRQIFRPGGDPYVLQATYVFSTAEGGDSPSPSGYPTGSSSSAPSTYTPPPSYGSGGGPARNRRL